MMENDARCQDCDAIAQELGEAYVEAFILADEATRDARLAIYEMIGGTEEDATRAGELMPRARFRNALEVNRALMRKFAHEARAGHKIEMPFTRNSGK